jgi:pimeloyl-ACP methyl ester carboxylesterase
MYIHPAPGSRETFLDEALQLGREGIASRLIQAPWAEGEAWARTLTTPEYTRAVYTAFVKDLRRGVDFLLARPETNGACLAYVGHSFGALFGGVLAGVEKRLMAFVLMAGAPSFTDVAVANMPSLKGEALELYAQAMAPIDPVHYVRHAAPSGLFFQCGRKDEAFSSEQFERLAQAASEPKRVKWYDAGHSFENGLGRQDRLEWLEAQLSGPPGA